jgi:hypothetical protein
VGLVKIWGPFSLEEIWVLEKIRVSFSKMFSLSLSLRYKKEMQRVEIETSAMTHIPCSPYLTELRTLTLGAEAFLKITVFM